jgi:hypothetical protein
MVGILFIRLATITEVVSFSSVLAGKCRDDTLRVASTHLLT